MKITVIEPSVELVTPNSHLKDAEKLIEKAGRTCYKSEDKITDGSAKKFVERIIRSGHESVIEHFNVTMKFIGDRSMSHQLVRHRLAAYSQESQRYCNYMDKGWTVICPATIAELEPGQYHQGNFDGLGKWEKGSQALKDTDGIRFLNAMADCFRRYEEFKNLNGAPVEDARCILPNAVKTEVIATYNLRTWRHIIEHRALNARAQWQIRSLMQAALVLLHEHIPSVFQDQMDNFEVC